MKLVLLAGIGAQIALYAFPVLLFAAAFVIGRFRRRNNDDKK